MAYITKRGNFYSVRYTYEDEHGKSCDKWESFPTKEEATNRKKQIEHELAAGTFLIPSSVTVAEFLAAGAERRPESSGQWLHHQGITGQAGAQHPFPHPEKHQNGVFLPYHRKSRPCKNRALTVQIPNFRGYITKKNIKSYDLMFTI